MAKQKNIKSVNNKRFIIKREGVSILIIGTLLFIISYSLDNEVAEAFKNSKSIVLDPVLSVVANFGVDMVFLLLIPSIILYRKNRKAVELLLLTFLISFMVSFILKLVFLKQRPMETFVYPFTSMVSYSFPSTHATVVFSLLPIIRKYISKNRMFFTWFSLLVVFTRIYFSFHFLTDVVFGSFLGYFIGSYMTELHEKGVLWKKI